MKASVVLMLEIAASYTKDATVLNAVTVIMSNIVKDHGQSQSHNSSIVPQDVLETLSLKENQQILFSCMSQSNDAGTLTSLLTILIVITHECMHGSMCLIIDPSYVDTLNSADVFNAIIHTLTVSTSNILVSQVIEFAKLLVLNRLPC